MIEFEAIELDWLIELLRRRAMMVEEAVAEGEQRASAFAARGGRQARGGRFLRRVSPQRPQRPRRPTASMRARGIEQAMYRRLINFFGTD